MWQWLYAGRWVDCEPQNQSLLDKDEHAPSMDRLYMVNRFGELWGCPSRNDMTFRVHGDDEEMRTKIRRGPEPNELPLYCILTRGHQRYLPYNVCRTLFEERKTDSDTYEAHLVKTIVKLLLGLKYLWLKMGNCTKK